MADQSKRERQKERRRAQQAAVKRARKRRARRRLFLRVALVALLVAGIVAGIAALRAGDDEEDVATEDTTTTTVPAAESAAGKPCVPMADPPPTGAPSVPVKAGPPPTALVKEDLKVGTGAAVTPTSTVTVNYIGVACSSGKVFDSSYARGQPATIPLTQVIQGWKDGLPGMNVGGQRLLGIPSEQAYGENGVPPYVAPDEALWFVVEVLEVKA